MNYFPLSVLNFEAAGQGLGSKPCGVSSYNGFVTKSYHVIGNLCYQMPTCSTASQNMQQPPIIKLPALLCKHRSYVGFIELFSSAPQDLASG